MPVSESKRIDVSTVSPTAWRLLRVAAGYSQRDVERTIDGLVQAHVSMLENDTRGLSADRQNHLLDLYAAELSDEQIAVLIEHF